MALSPDGMIEAVVRNLKNRTGRTLAQWVALCERSGLTEPQQLRTWLKARFGLGGTTCQVIAEATLGKPAPLSESEMLGAQFKGAKAALRPTYDRLVREVTRLGTDVRVGVRKTQTTFARTYTFAIAKAPTKARIDLGLRLPHVAPTKRLSATTIFAGNATHCVRLTSPQDVDIQLAKWVKAAYDARG